MLKKSREFKFIPKAIITAICSLVMPLLTYGASWSDNGSYSITWYNKNQTTFDISTPQEFAGLAYLVNNNLANFSGKTINITDDINLIGKTWTPIGTGSYVFQGTVEGNNHRIYNLDLVRPSSTTPRNVGVWIALKNAEIKNLSFSGSTTVRFDHVGFLSYEATSTKFENITVDCNVTYNFPDVHTSTSYSFKSYISGMIAIANSCTFTNVTVSDKIDYTFGNSNGNNCYGDIQLKCGGLIAEGSNCVLTKCHAINQSYVTINGFVTTTTYTGSGSSYVTFGGIAGYLSGNSSKIIGCFAENKSFVGDHACGTFDTTNFRFGGIVGYMSKYDSSNLKNCVAINDRYTISGHSYSWQASWYHTNSYFGGVAYEAPKNFAGCYSNNDVYKNITKVRYDNTFENGSTTFSKSQMNSQAFVDELNFFSQLEFDEDYWTLEGGKLTIKQDIDDSGVEYPLIDNDETKSIYSLQGRFVGNKVEDLAPGVYIVRSSTSTKKVVIR